MHQDPSKEYTSLQKMLSWLVHGFTASGIIFGFLAIIAVSEENFMMAFFYLFIALIIDGVDGTFARRLKIWEVLPFISGKTIDTVVDFVTYAIVPAYIIYAAKIPGTETYLVPDELRICSGAIIVWISAMYYGVEGMISKDYYFIGFPVLWNIVAFYLYYVLGLPPIWNFILIIIFTILHFVPIKYLYPSRSKKFQIFNILTVTSGLIGNFALFLIVEWENTANVLETHYASAVPIHRLILYGI